jgi:putative hydrolase of the HAD superfamily
MEAIHFSEGREQVFDKLVRRLDLPADWVPELVHVFRSHAPQIALDAGVASLLMRLRGRYRLGCVTDGWPDVQRRKVATLGLGPLLDAVVYTGDYARDRWKPSPFPFATCCGTLSVSPSEAVHVGDNPERDVRGARNAGLVSIRVRGGGAYFRDVPSGGDAADGEVTSVEQMEELLDGLE